LDSSKAPLYSNRAAGYLMVKDYRKALDDCKAAMKIDAKFGKVHSQPPQNLPPSPTLRICFFFAKVYPRAAKCLQQLGRFEEAIAMVKQAMELGEIGDWDGEIAALRALQKRAVAAMDLIHDKNWDSAIHHYMNLLPQCEAYVDGKVRYAQALLRGNRAQKALETVREALVDEPNHDLGQVVRAEALMYIGNPEAASKMVAQILSMDPDNTAAQQLRKKIRAIEASKERGNDHFKAGRHNEAIEAYTQGLADAAGIQSYCSVFYSNRAAAYMGVR
jgi:DnaJ homolog subfamily C member 7